MHIKGLWLHINAVGTHQGGVGTQQGPWFTSRAAGTHQGRGVHIKVRGYTSRAVGTHQGPWGTSRVVGTHQEPVGTHQGPWVHVKGYCFCDLLLLNFLTTQILVRLWSVCSTGLPCGAFALLGTTRAPEHLFREDEAATFRENYEAHPYGVCHRADHQRQPCGATIEGNVGTHQGP